MSKKAETRKRKRTGQKSQDQKWRRASFVPRSSRWSVWLFLLVVVLYAGIRYHLRDLPIERDEGEYAYAGQLILDGVPPYQFAYNMKLPGTYAAYAAVMTIFGQSSSGIHLGLLVVNLITTLSFWLLARRILGSGMAIVSAISYTVLSASAAVYGLAGHATQFVVAAAVPGILLLLYALDSDRLSLFFSSGTLLGLSFLMKQPGIVFSMFTLFYFAYRSWKRRAEWRGVSIQAFVLLAGVAWPFALTCLILYRATVFPKFWFWTFTYARAYGTSLPYASAIRALKDAAVGLMHTDGALWSLALCGLVALFWNARARVHSAFVAGLLLFSAIGVSAGFYFRNHYFVLLLPVVSLLCGIAIMCAADALQSRNTPAAITIPAVVFGLAVVFSFVQEWQIFFAPNLDTTCERLYFKNPFVEAQKIGDYLKAKAAPNAKLAIFGSEPEIYFYTHLRSATGYIYTYSLMEDQQYASRMQKEMFEEVSRARPDYVVFADDRLSWLWHPGGSRADFLWQIIRYVENGYEKAAQIDIQGDPDHVLDDRARIYVYARRDE